MKVDTTAPTSPIPTPQLRQEKSLKATRSRINKKKRKKGLELLQKLLLLIDFYPEFAGELQQSASRIQRETERTYNSDRERVLLSIEQGAWGVQDIMDDTGLSRWDVEKILDNLEDLRLVNKRPRRVKGKSNEYTEYVYSLTHDRPQNGQLKTA